MEIAQIDNLIIKILDKAKAEKYSNDLQILMNQIPKVEFSKSEILEEKKGERELLGKWSHSLIMFDNEKPVGIIIGYERGSENNEQYPINSIYIGGFSIAHNYQHKGLGKKFLKIFLDFNKKIGLNYLNGDVNFSVQTNSANWNKHVQKLYQSYGFEKISEKQYDNRIDNVYFLKGYI